MSRAYLGGFVVIAAVAVGAADYINQSRRAGSAPGAFGASDYVSTISGRVLGRQTALAAEPARGGPPVPEPGSVLPEVPEGTGSDLGETAAAEAVAAEAGTAPASAPAGGGILSMVGGLFGGGASPGAGTPEAATPAKVRPVASSGGFGGDCSVTMGVKRCSFGGN